MKACFLTFLTLLLIIAGNSFAAEKPNILFIYTDDHSHRTIGCYPESYDWVKTPNIDALAEKGVRFKYAYIGTWCMPSRATLLTGHHQYGVKSMRMVGTYPGSTYDPEQSPFWPKVFRENGYQTAQIGKWHTGNDTGFGRDWDYQIVWNRPGHPDNAGNYYKDQMIEFNGEEAKMVKGYSTDNYTKWALEYLNGKGRKADKPWYLWLCYGAVHGPFTPAKRHLEAYPGLKVAAPKDIYPPRPGKPAYIQNIANWVRGDDGLPHLRDEKRQSGEAFDYGSGIHGSTYSDWVRQYHQGVMALDEAVGKLVQSLKDTGQYENTLIVFTSDQGFAWGQHGFRTKVAPYDANIRSPFIISMPKNFPSGAVCDVPVGGVDVVPTFFDVAGIEYPWKMHGKSLLPLLKDPGKKEQRSVLVSFTGRRYGDDTSKVPRDPEVLLQVANVPWYASLHDGRYKYIRNLVEGEMEELYDLDSDPEELMNLALKKEHRERVLKMRAATVAELKRTDAGMVNDLPSVAKLPE